MPALRIHDRVVEGELIVFDKDGVLMDFRAFWGDMTVARARACCELAARPGLTDALTAFLGLGAGGAIAPGSLLAGAPRPEATIAAATFLHQAGLPWAEARRCAQEGFARADDAVRFETHCRAVPGVPEALRTLAAAGWKLAIATTDTHASAARFVEHLGVADLFCSLQGADRVAHSKPAPDLFLGACRDAGVAPGAALVVGDLVIDIAMGRAGGARATVGVLSGIGTLAELEAEADWVVGSVADLASV